MNNTNKQIYRICTLRIWR